MTIIAAIEVKKSVQTLASPIDILKGVNLNVNAGEAIAIVGPSGSGKTTLLGLLAGLDVPSSGEIWLEGQCVSTMTEDERANSRKGRVGFVFQNFDLLPSLSALENVMLPGELCGMDAMQDKATAILSKVGLENRLTHFPHQLSGGEQQRVAIARAYVTSPKILFADEPTGSLDTKNGDKIIELLFELKKQLHTTLIFVTHDLELAKRCERTYLLEEGTLQLSRDN